MKISAVTLDDIGRSVWAVPPLALTETLSPDVAANRALACHIEVGGVTTLLYGGNANLYNLPASAFGEVFD